MDEKAKARMQKKLTSKGRMWKRWRMEEKKGEWTNYARRPPSKT